MSKRLLRGIEHLIPILKLTLSIQLLFWLAITLDIPVIRQVIGFIYLTFIPGVLLIEILKPCKLTFSENLLLSVGLSLTIVMFAGGLINILLPWIGILNPISTLPLIVTISTVVSILCGVCYYKRAGDLVMPTVNVSTLFTPPTLFLILLPLLSILGTSLVNSYNFNLVLLLLILLIALIVFFVGFSRFISAELYPLAIVAAGIALLFHRSLISPHLIGADIQIEYYFAKQVMTNSFWDSAIPHVINACLSIVLLAPTYSRLLHLDVVWVFKVIYPLIFSLVPLTIYETCKKSIGEQKALFSAFLFISMLGFYGEMVGLARQQIAMLFLSLIIFLFTRHKDFRPVAGKALLIIFIFGLVVSHYGLSYHYLFFSLLAITALYLMRQESQLLNYQHLTLYLVLVLSWYIYNSSSTVFNIIVGFGDHVLSNLVTSFGEPETREALGVLTRKESTILHQVTKFLNIITQFFIFIGITQLMVKGKKKEFTAEHIAFFFSTAIWLLVILLIPNFMSLAYHQVRAYLITLLILAPLSIIGGEVFFNWVGKSLTKISRKFLHITDLHITDASVKMVSLFLIIYLLFNSGFIYVIAGDPKTTPSFDNTMEYARFSGQQDRAAIWILKNMGDSQILSADPVARCLFLRYMPGGYTSNFWALDESKQIPITNGYVYLRVRDGKTPLYYHPSNKMEYTDLRTIKFLAEPNKIFDNRDVQILLIKY